MCDRRIFHISESSPLLQAVEDGTLDETEAKKHRRRKRKTNDPDDTTPPAKVCISTHDDGSMCSMRVSSFLIKKKFLERP